jgi:hypothetical protein
MEEAPSAVSTVGFPIVVALYVLIRQEGVMKELKKSVDLLTIVVANSSGLSLDKIKKDYGKNGQS